MIIIIKTILVRITNYIGWGGKFDKTVSCVKQKRMMVFQQRFIFLSTHHDYIDKYVQLHKIHKEQIDSGIEVYGFIK